ncbi:MAG: response regulator [Candidatus Promineifilaceae bacterium]
MISTRILLVDDHAVVRAGLRNALEGLASVSVVGEVEDGLGINAALEKLQPNCLLIDITMPNFEPISAIRSIRQRYPDLKILVVSAYDDDIYVQGLLSVGVNGYHLKDQPLSDLRLALQQIMAGKRWVTGRLLDKLLNPSRASLHQLPQLTPRQRDILGLLQQGYDNQRIASQIGISIKTVENHLTRLYRQLNVQSRLEAVNFVRDHPKLLQQERGKRSKVTRRIVGNSAEKPTILVVDDNRRFRSQLRRMITKLAPFATITEAENTNTALRQAKRSSPKLVFVDVVLGNEDGIRCTRQLKSHANRIILMSAYPDREFHRRGLEAGATAFLDKKDLDSAVLNQIIQDILG